MRRLLTYLVIVLAAAALAASAQAVPHRCSIRQSAKLELRCGIKAYNWGASGVRWYKNQNHRFLSDQITAQQAHLRLIKRLRWEKEGKHWIHQARRRLAVVSVFPPHHLLWLCIHGFEASSWYDRDSGHNRHYGGLQMTYDWGNGITGYAYNYTQAQQEWAAERGYDQGGISFLWRQWFDYDGAAPTCLKYA